MTMGLGMLSVGSLQKTKIMTAPPRTSSIALYFAYASVEKHRRPEVLPGHAYRSALVLCNFLAEAYAKGMLMTL